jgi:hypothetical protein
MAYMEDGKTFIYIPNSYVFDLVDYLERNQLHGTLFEKYSKDILLDQLYDVIGEGAELLAEEERKKEDRKNSAEQWMQSTKEEERRRGERRKATLLKNAKIKEVIKET